MPNLTVDSKEELLKLNKILFDIPYQINRQIINKQIGSNIAIEYSNLIKSKK